MHRPERPGRRLSPEIPPLLPGPEEACLPPETFVPTFPRAPLSPAAPDDNLSPHKAPAPREKLGGGPTISAPLPNKPLK